MRNNSNNAIASKIPPPFFIMGCPRAGTTLVSQILDSHSRIAVFHETAYYRIFRPILHCYGDLRESPNLLRLITDLREIIRAQGVKLPEIEEFCKALVAPSFEGVLATLLQLYAQRQGKIRSGDKTPEHYAYLSEILEKFPESPVIFIIRDPRDTVLSMRRAFGTSIAGAIRFWNEAFLSYSRATKPVHLVRYEQFVQDPVQGVRDMCALLGESYEPAMLRFFERIPKHVAALGPHHWKLFGPVVSTHVGSFRTMSIHDIERIEVACAFGLEAMGYPFTTHLKVMKRVAPKRGSLLIVFLDALRYYRGNKGRWRRGWVRWKIILRARARYSLGLSP